MAKEHIFKVGDLVRFKTENEYFASRRGVVLDVSYRRGKQVCLEVRWTTGQIEYHKLFGIEKVA